MTSAFLPIAACVALAGSGLLWLGLRGRRVDDHPVCRRCGRDLTGIESDRCPECGRPTGDARVGNRVRRGRLVAAGATLTVLAGLPLAVAAVSYATGFEIDRLKPLPLLLWESRTSPGAVAEINRRESAGELDAGQRAEVVAGWLDDQADAELPWLTGKGDLLYGLYQAGRLPPGDGQRFLEQAVVPTLLVRPRGRSGSPLPVWERGTTRGAAPRGRFGIVPEMDAALVLVRDGERVGASTSRFGNRGGSTRHDAVGLAGVPPGQYGMAVEPVAPGTRTSAILARPTPPPPPFAQVTVVPADQPTATAVDDAALRARVVAGTHMDTSDHTGGDRGRIVRLWWGPQNRRDRRHSFSLDFDLTPLAEDPLPIALAYRILLDDGRQRWDAGKLVREAGSEVYGQGYGSELPADFDADVVDLILSPSVEVAEGTPTIDRFLGGDEIRFEDVEVRWQGRPAPATTRPGR